MDNKEMNRIVAEKVHGWHRQPWNAWNKDAKPLYGFWADEKDTFQESLEGYSPATNIAQAFEAIEAWRDKTGRHWDISSPVFGGDEKFYCAIYHLADGEDWARADTPAQAITEALVKAVSDG